MEYISDEVYIKRVLSGDSRAFSCLVERHKAMVFTITLRITEQREDAEEVSQDVFLKMYQALHTFKGNSKFTTWLYSIAYNMAISHVRKSRPNYVPLSDVEYKMSDETDEIIIPIRGRGANYKLLLTTSANSPRIHYSKWAQIKVDI